GRRARRARPRSHRAARSRRLRAPALGARQGALARPRSSRRPAGSSAGCSRLAQQGAGGALEDFAPRADVLVLGAKALDHLAHALARDLDPVAFGDLLIVLVLAGQVLR